MKNFIVILLALLISVPVFSQKKKNRKCTKTSKINTIKSTTQDGLIYLKEGENIFLQDQQMNVTFKQITEDSRCPENARCVWQGVATAEIELMGTYTRPVTLTINDIDMPDKGYSRKVFFNGYQITLEHLSPNRVAGQEKKLKGLYKIGLRFEKTTK
jgi:hypothetical protein